MKKLSIYLYSKCSIILGRDHILPFRIKSTVYTLKTKTINRPTTEFAKVAIFTTTMGDKQNLQEIPLVRTSF